MTLRIAATLAGVAIVITVALIAARVRRDAGASLLAGGRDCVARLVLGVTHMLATATLHMLLAVMAFRGGCCAPVTAAWWSAIGATAGVAMTEQVVGAAAGGRVGWQPLAGRPEAAIAELVAIGRRSTWRV